jgi:hypothetical protein
VAAIFCDIKGNESSLAEDVSIEISKNSLHCLTPFVLPKMEDLIRFRKDYAVYDCVLTSEMPY